MCDALTDCLVMLGYSKCPTARRNKSGYRETKTDTHVCSCCMMKWVGPLVRLYESDKMSEEGVRECNARVIRNDARCYEDSDENG